MIKALSYVKDLKVRSWNNTCLGIKLFALNINNANVACVL